MDDKKVKVNRAPVLTLWAAVVEERLGYTPEEALTLGKMVAGLNAQSKGRRLGIYEPSEEEEKERKAREEREAKQPGAILVQVLGRPVPAMKTEAGVRATAEGKPVSPQSVEHYLEGKFGDDLEDVRSAMKALAESYSPDELKKKAYDLYEAFRPVVPEGTRGWGAKGVLDLGKIRSLQK